MYSNYANPLPFEPQFISFSITRISKPEEKKMNRCFKIVFNKARGCLMVVNEITSSVQKSSAKSILMGAIIALTGFALSDLAVA